MTNHTHTHMRYMRAQTFQNGNSMSLRQKRLSQAGEQSSYRDARKAKQGKATDGVEDLNLPAAETHGKVMAAG